MHSYGRGSRSFPAKLSSLMILLLCVSHIKDLRRQVIGQKNCKVTLKGERIMAIREFTDENQEKGILSFYLTKEEEDAGVCMLTAFGRDASLRYLGIREDLQQKGLGTDLLLESLLRTRQKGYTRFSLSVLPSDAPALIRMAEHFGMEKREGFRSWFTLKLSDAEKLAKVKGNREGIRSLKDLSEEEKERFSERIEKDLAESGISPVNTTQLDPELSFVKIEDGECVAGLFTESSEGKLYLSWVFNDTEDPMVPEGLFSSAFEKATEKYPGRTELSLAALDERTAELLSAVPSAKGEEMAEYTMDLTILDTALEAVFDEDEEE